MDIAEIRKKARAGKTPGVSVPVESPALAAAAEPAASAAAPAATAEIPGSAPGNPLDALFAFRPDVVLATEENYLQALRARDEDKVEELQEWLTFSLGNEEYALDIAGVGEIIKLREITDLPRVPEFILGVISLRGIIIPVFDLRRRLKLGVAECTASSRIIVCQSGELSAGLLVDSITQVVRMDARGIEPPPAVLSGLDRDLVEGVGRHQGRLLILLSLQNVLNVQLI
jgi:purine-binding chemotaxis protein CheW